MVPIESMDSSTLCRLFTLVRSEITVREGYNIPQPNFSTGDQKLVAIVRAVQSCAFLGAVHKKTLRPGHSRSADPSDIRISESDADAFEKISRWL